MAIKDPILFITVEEFKNSKYFNELLFDKVTTPDNEIWFAISVASSNIDYLSGFTISKKWPEITPTDFTDNIQTATTNYVRFLLTKDVDYLRGQGSISQGGLTYSETNPDDPYFIPPEVFNYLRKIKEYPNIKGFDLKGIEPQKNNYFNKFISNCGEDSPLNEYIPYTNLESSDTRTKITITHPQNRSRPVINIDTRGINTSTTVPEFKSPKETIDIKYDKETHIVNSDVSDKVIYFDDLDDRKNAIEILKHTLVPNFIYKWVAYKNFDPFTEDYSSYLNGTLIPKKYADDKLQNKLIAGNNITIDKETNTISATGGSSVDENRIFNNKNDKDNTTRLVNDVINVGNRTLIYKNKSGPSVTDDNDIPNKKYVDEKIKSLNVIKWKNIGTKESNIKINYDFKVNTLYRVGYCWKNVEKSPIIYMQFLWQGEGAVLASFFKGISGKRITEAYVDLVVISNAIAMDRFNDDEGKIYSLEEEIKENTYKITSNTLDITSPSIINIDKPIKINSKSLETNEIEDNCWDIELKDNPTPNPNPSVPQWKEVAVSTDLVTINYNLKNKNYYRVFYNGRTRDLITNIGKGTHEIKEFYYQDNKDSFILGIFNMMLSVMPMYIKNNGVSLYAGAPWCNLWKLEELQE
ncbi:hypothetical protein [Spiroplasma endosymbiont of Virgichneumon dumeticola]|uniref:hypothetical protein n=1 Tax=Spiroplasma endosymbiont of Virgichneumon dumeticola TaxID=3139323 RepID=UPI0035C8C2C8